MVFGLAGLVLGIFLAGKFGAELGQSVLSNAQPWGTVVAYVIIFIAAAVVAGIIGAIVSKVVHAATLGWIDRLVGIIAGALSGLLTVAAIIAALSVFMPDKITVVNESWLGALLLSWAPYLLALLPEGLLKTGSVTATST